MASYNLFIKYLTNDEYLDNTDIEYSNKEDDEGVFTADLITKAISWASFRINKISSNLINKYIVDYSKNPPTIDWNKIEAYQERAVKQATVFYTDHFLTYGMDWLRGSSSISLGMASVSQSQPTEPDYVPQPVIDCLSSGDFYNAVLNGTWE